MDQQPAPVSEKQPLVVLTTPRLILRAAVEADISVLHDLIFGDGEVMRFAFAGAPMAGDAAEDSSGDPSPSAKASRGWRC